LPIYFIIKNRLFEQGSFLAIFLAVSGLIIVNLIVFLLMAVIVFFAEDFVLPIMYKQNLRIKQGWGEFWSILKNKQSNFFLYLLLKFGLAIVGIILAGIVLIIPMIILGLIFFALLWLTRTTVSSTGMAWLLAPFGIIIIAFSIFIGYASVCLTLPIPVFFRCLSLVFLGRCAREYLLLENEEIQRI